MFYALKDSNRLVRADQAQATKKYYCPFCHEQVILRKGPFYQSHFAHKKQCLSKTALETSEHQDGKALLLMWAKAAGYQAQAEVYLQALAQRPDILAKKDERELVIEFQCAPLSYQNLCQRTAGYKQAGYQVIWILGMNYRLRSKLDQKTAQFMHYSKKLGFYLIYLDVLEQRFEIDYALQMADLLELRYFCGYATDLKALKKFCQTDHHVSLAHLSIQQQEQQLGALESYVNKIKYGLRQQAYAKNLTLQQLLKANLSKRYYYPLWRTACFYWKTKLFLQYGEKSQTLDPAYISHHFAYKLAFITLEKSK